MRDSIVDHGLPLVCLKEQRRDLVLALAGQCGPVQAGIIAKLAAVQQAIAAVEAVVVDLDAELSSHPATGAGSLSLSH